MPDGPNPQIFLWAPTISAFVSFINLVFVALLFKFNRQKDRTDRKIKWFQELVYSPNKEVIKNFFEVLHRLQEKTKGNSVTDNDTRIALINEAKAARTTFLAEFVDMLGPLNEKLKRNISEEVENLIDDITKILDDDTIHDFTNISPPKTTISSRVRRSKVRIFNELFGFE
ncbi:MAG: hypothetical protein JSR97_03155 [Verrucomicrobia bacterium]|nr:hypothetical protein [Verrucomicrobiota bacterium]